MPPARLARAVCWLRGQERKPDPRRRACFFSASSREQTVGFGEHRSHIHRIIGVLFRNLFRLPWAKDRGRSVLSDNYTHRGIQSLRVSGQQGQLNRFYCRRYCRVLQRALNTTLMDRATTGRRQRHEICDQSQCDWECFPKMLFPSGSNQFVFPDGRILVTGFIRGPHDRR